MIALFLPPLYFTPAELLQFASDAAFYAADMSERAGLFTAEAFRQLGDGFRLGARMVGGWEELEDNHA